MLNVVFHLADSDWRYSTLDRSQSRADFRDWYALRGDRITASTTMQNCLHTHRGGVSTHRTSVRMPRHMNRGIARNPLQRFRGRATVNLHTAPGRAIAPRHSSPGILAITFRTRQGINNTQTIAATSFCSDHRIALNIFRNGHRMKLNLCTYITPAQVP